MGVVIEPLWDHEGYGARRLPDGTLTGSWTWATREFDGYVAACGCGWRSPRDWPPTEDGEALAVDQWESEHATPLLARQAVQRQRELARRLEWLGSQAGRLHDPQTVARVRSTLDRLGDLIAQVQRDLERPAPAREGDGER
jgi:hypothetical protein